MLVRMRFITNVQKAGIAEPGEQGDTPHRFW